MLNVEIKEVEYNPNEQLGDYEFNEEYEKGEDNEPENK